MKISASIFLLILSFLTVQPLLARVKTVEQKTCCAKTKMSCDQKKQDSDPAKECQREHCNPFMACALGNFYMNEKTAGEIVLISPRNEGPSPVNDNRLASCLSDCWHPPERF